MPDTQTSQPRIVDLSVPIDERYWEPDPVRVEFIDHQRGADLLGRSFAYLQARTRLSRLVSSARQRLGRGVDHRDFPDGKGLSLMRYTLTTHTGTHMDAPFHYGDLDSKGRPARTISEVPLEWCYADGVLLDLTRGDPAQPVGADEVARAVTESGAALAPMNVVLLRTNGDSELGQPGYFNRFRGVSREATAYLLRHGVKVIGIDSFGFDAPFTAMLGRYIETRDQRCLWPAHMYGREREYCQLERLTNLGAIGRSSGFKICCFPIKLARADAAWCRVVAIA